MWIYSLSRIYSWQLLSMTCRYHCTTTYRRESYSRISTFVLLTSHISPVYMLCSNKRYGYLLFMCWSYRKYLILFQLHSTYIYEIQSTNNEKKYNNLLSRVDSIKNNPFLWEIPSFPHKKAFSKIFNQKKPNTLYFLAFL